MCSIARDPAPTSKRRNAEAAAYGDNDYPWDMQRDWVAQVLRLIRPGGSVLDAPCGTGKYFPKLAAAGVRVAGADQSAGMLARTRAQGIAFCLEQTSLQEPSYAGQFDAVLTIDAMEHIPPEDWPLATRSRRSPARGSTAPDATRKSSCWPGWTCGVA
jgi:2-polyprenyl-3-methyl-5-hydroxy-6-metoxy-1,4-benzoquinol methylase